MNLTKAVLIQLIKEELYLMKGLEPEENFLRGLEEKKKKKKKKKKLTKIQIKKRDKLAKKIMKNTKKEYGKERGEDIAYAIATNQVKSKKHKKKIS